MFTSATASPFASPLATPLQPRSPLESPALTPLPSAPHSPASISIDFASSHSKQPGAPAPYSKAFGSLTPAGPSSLIGIDSRRNSFAASAGGGGSGAQQALYYDAPSRSGSSDEHSNKRSQGSRLLFQAEGGSGGQAMGGLNLDRDYSRSGSGTPPLGMGGMGGGGGPGSFTVEQLLQCGEALASGIVTSFDMKKKDAQGRTYLNCFFGKEAINCLRQRLPKSSNTAETCTAILQQMLTDGLLVMAQSTEELDKTIAAKFATSPPPSAGPPTGGRASPGPSPKLNPLALKLNLSAIGAAVPPPPTFKKEGLYQLSSTHAWGAGAGSAGSSAANSATNSLRSSPVMFAAGGAGVVGSATWYSGYSGYLGKKRENKGLGNSLALGFGVSTFQRRWFVCSAREQAVIYYKDDPNHAGDAEGGGGALSPGAAGGSAAAAAAAAAAALPLGFIPFSEILLVDHLQSSANQLAAANAASSLNARGKKSSVDKTGGRGTPPPGHSTDEKAGRLFDIIASFRIYHLQADSAMDAMRWAQAIKESVRDFYTARAERLLGAPPPAAQALNAAAMAMPNAGYNTLKLAAQARTPRTPEHEKRFWSNAATPSLNASAFPEQYLRQVLRDNSHTHTNGLYGSKIVPQRISDLRRYFFELNFSISSLDQPSYFDHFMSDFDTDAKIVEFCWNVIMRGTANANEWGPRSFRSAAATTGAAAGVTSPHSASGVFSPSSALSPGGVVSPQQAVRSFVDSSASTVLLARMREAEYAYDATATADYAEAGDYEASATAAAHDDGDNEEDTQQGQRTPAGRFSLSMGRSVLSSGGRRHRRCISDSMLPDFVGRGLEKAEGQSGSRGHKREDSFNLGALQARRELNNTRKFHRRFHSSLFPLPRALADDSYGAGAAAASSDRGEGGVLAPLPPPDKFHDFSYMLLNKYALYHASAYKASSAGGGGGAGSGEAGPLNPAFLYRIFQPYQRIESWLHSDCFLNLLLNDAQLVNEVALALPLVWLVLQWRNHDTDPHACAGDGGEDGHGGFIDDACLRKNWLDPTVDGEDDGYDGGLAEGGVALNESEAREAKTAREESAKAGFRSVARAHLRVDSFSNVADTFATMTRPGGPQQALSAGSPLSPPTLAASSAPPAGTPNAHAHVPVVYGAHGQIVRGRSGHQGPMGSPQSSHGQHHQHQQPTVAGLTSPQSQSGSSALYEYEAATPATPGNGPYPSASPLSPPPARTPPTPVHIHLDHPSSGAHPHQHPPLVRSVSSPGMQAPPPPPPPPPQSALPPPGAAGFQTPPRLHRAPPRLHSSPHTPHTPHTPLTPSMSPVLIGTPDMRKVSSGSSGGYPERERRDVTFAGEVECLSLIGEREVSVSSTSSRSEYEREPGAGRGSDSAEGVPTSAQLRAGPRGSASMPNTRRNSLVHSAAAAAAATASHAHQSSTSSKGSESGGSVYTTPRLLPRSVTSASARTSPAPSPNMRGRQRAAIFQTASATMRPPNLLQGAGGGYATFRSTNSASSGTTSAAASQPPPIPLGLPHWKVRSLVGCRFCFQSSVEFMQCVSERYGLDGAAAEAKRRRRARVAAAAAAGKPLRSPICIEEPDTPPAQLSIAIANTLFSLLLTPLYSLPSLNSPCLVDSFNVLGKCIVQPHIWPTLIACLQQATTTPQRRPSIHMGSYSSSALAAAAAAAANAAAAPHLKHHVLKDLNTLFIGSNVAANNRNCALLFKFFAAVSRRERKDALQAAAERERERKLSEKERERAERRRRRQPKKPVIGAWQQGLLELLRAHVPASSSALANSSGPGGRYATLNATDAGVERVHSKIYQYTLNLFGVLHFYKFQCIGASLTNLHLSGAKVGASSPGSNGGGDSLATTCADFERLFKESFWRSMHMDDAAIAKRAAKLAAASKRASPATGAGQASASGTDESAALALRAATYASAGPPLAHTVARSMLTTMLQRLMFKIKSKTLHLEQRWPAVAFLLQLVKSFVFSLPLRQAAGSMAAAGGSNAPNGGTSASGDALLDLEQDFSPGHETLHRVVGQSGPTAALLHDDIELLEKALELLRALRLYQELDVESMGAAKQRELKAHVEAVAQASGRGVRLGDLHDPTSKLKLNAAHEDLAALFRNLIPTDQAALKFLQQQVSFLKDAVCFLAMMSQHRRAANMDPKELTPLVAHFVTIERREKVFCAK